LLLFTQQLPRRFGSGLHVQNPLQRRQRVGVITNGTLHRRHYVVSMIGTDERQDTLRLMLAITLLLEKSFKEATGNLSDFTKSLS